MSHYSLGQKPKELFKWAENMALSFLDKGIHNPVLVYSGMSGISAATALSLALYKLGVYSGMIYVRKEGEKCHGRHIEREVPGDWENSSITHIFVDDFIVDGINYDYCKNQEECRLDWVAMQYDNDYRENKIYTLMTYQEYV